MVDAVNAHSGGPSNRLQSLLASAVFGVDRYLQRREGVFCFTSDTHCIFRIKIASLGAEVILDNEITLSAGMEIVELHIWNEQVPTLRDHVSPVAWGLSIRRAFPHSLKLLSGYLAERADFARIGAIGGNVALFTAEDTKQHLRTCGRLGFVRSRTGWGGETGEARRLGENILIALMILALNPGSCNFSSLRRNRVPIFMTRAELDRRYGAARVCSSSHSSERLAS
ncbi:MAG: hypothetical protein WBX25_08045 [Rhodomicrobium sp.]